MKTKGVKIGPYVPELTLVPFRRRTCSKSCGEDDKGNFPTVPGFKEVVSPQTHIHVDDMHPMTFR